MKKKLLVLLIAAIPMLIPNLASAIAIDMGEVNGSCGLGALPCPQMAGPCCPDIE